LGNGEGKKTGSGMLKYMRQERKWTLGGGILSELHYNKIIIIKCINCNWVVTRWQWLFYMCTNMGEKKVTRKFKSGGLHEKHVVATWKLGNHLSNRL